MARKPASDERAQSTDNTPTGAGYEPARELDEQLESERDGPTPSRHTDNFSQNDSAIAGSWRDDDEHPGDFAPWEQCKWPNEDVHTWVTMSEAQKEKVRDDPVLEPEDFQ